MASRPHAGARSAAAHVISQVRSEPLSVLVQADVTVDNLEQIRKVSSLVRLIDRQALEREPHLLERAEVLFTQKFDPLRVAAAPSLRWVQTYSSGVEWLLSPELLARSGLRVTNARGIHAQPIAEHVFGLILSFIRRLDGAFAQQQRGEWSPTTLVDGVRTLAGTTLGILGLGAIGARIADIGKAFGMRVIGIRRNPVPTDSVDRVYPLDALHQVLAESDFVVNALPWTRATDGVLDRAALETLPRGAVVVNIGRGATIDTDALVDALASGKLGGALLDVTDPEPLPAGHALWTTPNTLVTPHYAGAHPAYRDAATAIFVDNLRRYLQGEPLVNQVDLTAGY